MREYQRLLVCNFTFLILLIAVSAIGETADVSTEVPIQTFSVSERRKLLRDHPERLSRDTIQGSFLNFSSVSEGERDSVETAKYLSDVFDKAKERGLLDEKVLRHLGFLYAGDSFDPHGLGFGRNSRREFEYARKELPVSKRSDLDAGLRARFSAQLSHARAGGAREALNALVKAMPIWGADRYSKSADYLFGPAYIESWDLAIKHLGLLFLLKAREVSTEAKLIADRIVKEWLKDLASRANAKPQEDGPEIDAHLEKTLTELGRSDVLSRLREQAQLPSNRHVNGAIHSPPIIYAHQYRNLILKEILHGYALTPSERDLVALELEQNERELAGMLGAFKNGETTTDELSGFNTYTLVTTVLTARNPGLGLDAIKRRSHTDFAAYYIDSPYPASPRAGAARTVPFRLAEMAHTTDRNDLARVKTKLALAADNYMTYLPDLMFHSRGRYMHNGEDQLAPYYFHPTVPYEAAALRILANDPFFSLYQRARFNDHRKELLSAILSSQRSDGTFALPDASGDHEGGGAYSSSAAWVNPLVGLALLPLIDDAKESFTRFGILNVPQDYRQFSTTRLAIPQH